jgi:hypothetical protein
MTETNQPPTEAVDQPATDAVETAAAVPTDLAWSDESEGTERASRDWRGHLVWAALVALLCSTVGAVTWFSTVYYREQSHRPPVSMPNTNTAQKPTAPATVTVTPAPAAPTAQLAPSTVPSSVAPVQVQFSATDQQFLANLQRVGIGIGTGDAAEYAIEKAHAVCDHVASHPDAVVGSMVLDDWIASTTIYGGNAGQFALYSAVSYCPQRVSPDY